MKKVLEFIVKHKMWFIVLGFLLAPLVTSLSVEFMYQKLDFFLKGRIYSHFQSIMYLFVYISSCISLFILYKE